MAVGCFVQSTDLIFVSLAVFSSDLFVGED